eukprot:5506408-Amphidinium_carterae.1
MLTFLVLLVISALFSFCSWGTFWSGGGGTTLGSDWCLEAQFDTKVPLSKSVGPLNGRCQHDQ